MYRSSATISEDGLYRYDLRRDWEPTIAATRATFILLNPSTADADKDDATIRRCIGYARRWGMHGMTVVNLFALRSTDPRALYNAEDPVGPGNEKALLDAAVNARLVVAAWGNHGRLMNRGDETTNWLKRHATLWCFNLSATGQPVHPLYQRSDRELQLLAQRTWL